MGSKDKSELLESLLDAYKGLGTRGKPLPHEHTSLAGIAIEFDSLLYDNQGMAGKVVFVALATGTKCISASARSQNGFALHDGHGEILARRIVVRWLIEEIKVLYNGSESHILQIREGDTCVSLRKGVTFHLIVTSPPCGDCAVVCDQNGEAQSNKKRYRTGAKVITKPSEIPQASAVEKYDSSQMCGAVRRKPGRGDPTSSVSCSDKILKWNILGFQGCLLKSLMDTSIYFSSITIAYVRDTPGVALDIESKVLHRALWQRAFWDLDNEQCTDMLDQSPKLLAVAVSREKMATCGLLQSESRSSPSGASALWWAKPSCQWNVRDGKYSSQVPRGSNDTCEILVGKTGYKMGSPKVIPKDDKKLAEKFSSRFSRAAIRSQVDEVLKKRGIEVDSLLPYHEYKAKVCPEYIDTWKTLRKPPSLFSKWIVKNNV